MISKAFHAALLLLFASGCAEDVVGSSAAVVYGDDSRLEPFQVTSAIHADIARSQVAVRIVDWAVDFSAPAAPVVTYSRTLAESEDLCEGEAFADQIAPGSCSATLIDERHLLTAAHCVQDPDECDGSHYWVFGFEALEDGQMAPLRAEDVYTCSRVLVSDAAADYAIVELAREVVGRVPVETRVTRGGLDEGTALTLIGFPSGIPVKVDGGGVVRSSIAGVSFRADVDAFSSSSGSGVFDEMGRLVGFLQQGAQDYVSVGECNIVNVVDAAAGGERVAYLDLVLAAYCEANATSGLCTCDGPCADMPDAGAGDAGVSDVGGAVGSDAGSDGGADDAGAEDAGAGDAGPLASGDGGRDAGVAPPSGGCALGGGSPFHCWAWVALALVTLRRRLG